MVTVIVPLLCPRPPPYRPLPNRRTAWSRTPEFSLSEIAMMRSLTPGARWKRRFSFLIVDVPASYQRNLLRDCHLTGTPSVLILSSRFAHGSIDPILMPDSRVPGASCSIHSAIDFFGSPIAAFDTSSHASHVFSRSAYAARALGRIEVPRPSRSGGFSASTSFRMASAVASGSPRSTFGQMRQELLPELRVWFQRIRDL